jgi:predicted translin family RNA/ssDNA-binding protein
MATGNTTIDRFFRALEEASSALMERTQSANERAYRLAKAVLEDANAGREEALELGRKIVKDPTDVLGIYTIAFEKANLAQSRAFRLSRRSVEELIEAGKETRETAQRVAGASREIGQASVDVIREFFGRTGDAVQAAFSAGVSAVAPKPEPARPARRAAAQEAA